MTINKENKMAVMPVPKLLMQMALPMMISMMIQALYNIVDSLFVANIPEIGETCMNALALATPMQMLIISCAVGVGVGINAVLSRAIGSGNKEKADKIVANVLIILTAFSIVFFIFSITLTRFYFSFQTTNNEVIELGTTYLQIITAFSFAKIFQIGFERMLQSTGRTFLTMISQATGALLNIILDYILIVRLNMGIQGAAIATIIAQIIALFMVVMFNILYNKEVKIKLNRIKLDKKIMQEIFTVAIPSIMMQALMSVSGLLYNLILMNVSELAVTARGIFFKLNGFVVMPVFGINNAMIPIVGFSYGAKLYDRIREAIKYAIIYSMIILGTGFLIIQLFAPEIMMIYNASDELLTIAVPAFRIFAIYYPIIAISIPLEGALQALDRNKQALIETLIRLVIIQLPLAYILTLLPNAETTVWFAALIAETVACIYVIIIYKRIKFQ